MTSGWTVHSERVVYDSFWVSLSLADVEAPDGHRVREHHVVRAPLPAAGTVVHVDGRVMLLWRYRFITGSSSWEIPAGRLEQGEAPADGAAREALEETGWRVGPLTPLLTWHPAPGLVDQTFHAFLATEAERVGEPEHTHEAERIEWLTRAEISAALDAGQINDGFATTALLAFLRRYGG